MSNAICRTLSLSRATFALTIVSLVATALAAVPAAATKAAKQPPPASKASAGQEKAAPTTAAVEETSGGEPDMTLRGGEEVTAFGSLTVEGEDRIHVTFDRPVLELAIDPATAPGLDWGSPADVLMRTAPNRVEPFLALSAQERSPYLGKPWLRQFATGSVAVFRPQVTEVDRWKLSIVDSRGQVVAYFEDKGQPREIVWDGQVRGGGYVVPGRVYSSVFEARDRAGNKRSMVGDGFQVGPYRYDAAGGSVFLFSAADLSSPGDAAPGLILEAASWINQGPVSQPVRVFGIARTHEGASAVASRAAAMLKPWVLGGASRIQTAIEIEADAPTAGSVRIATGAAAGAAPVRAAIKPAPGAPAATAPRPR
jgi:hypothetical protein